MSDLFHVYGSFRLGSRLFMQYTNAVRGSRGCPFKRPLNCLGLDMGRLNDVPCGTALINYLYVVLINELVGSVCTSVGSLRERHRATTGCHVQSLQIPLLIPTNEEPIPGFD